MDSDCLSLLPPVCEVLADPKLLLPDDTSLEKLLDSFKHLLSRSDGQCIIQRQPYLLHFFQAVVKCEAVEPVVFSFTLRLAGLLAAEEDNFLSLEDRGVLLYLFEPKSWQRLELWRNASVRCGWLQGLRNMLQHQPAMDFLCRKGLIKRLLWLQNDESLFVGSLANQVLAHVLGSSTESGPLRCSPDGADGEDWSSASEAVMSHIAQSLASEEQEVLLSGLKLLAVALTQCGEPLKDVLWKRVLEPLEKLATQQDDSLTQPIMMALQAAAQSALISQPDSRVGELMEAVLCSREGSERVKCVALILQLETCPEALNRKATCAVLQPLLRITAAPPSSHGPEDCDSLLENQLSQKISCVSLLTQSLSSVARLIYTKRLENTAVHLIISSVASLLRMCIGHHTNTALTVRSVAHLIGCCKVQRCSLDVLGSLTVYKESEELTPVALPVLLLYLQCPGLPATVLKKAHHAAVRWLRVCSPIADFWRTITQDLFPVLMKHTCDGRWEVRDSTLEFVLELSAALRGHSSYAEALHTSGMISVMFSSLLDVEAYVRASAVAALGEALTADDLPLRSSLQEEAVSHLLTILSADSENFPRRAVLRVFGQWLKSSPPIPALERSLGSVLSLGSSDFDWEVKVLTLELADMLVERSIQSHKPPGRPCSEQKEALRGLKDLGLLNVLLKGLFDWDRPVSLKACTILLKIRTFMRETSHTDVTVELRSCSWSEELLCRCQAEEPAERLDPGWPKKIGLFRVLELLDLEDLQIISSQSSDHVMNSPRSVMEDILLVAQQSEETIADCY